MKKELTDIQQKQYDSLKESDAQYSFISWVSSEKFSQKEIDLIYEILKINEDLGFSACEMWPHPKLNKCIIENLSQDIINKIKTICTVKKEALNLTKYREETIKNLKLYLAMKAWDEKSFSQDLIDFKIFMHRSTSKELFTYRGMKSKELNNKFLDLILEDGIYMSKKHRIFKFLKKDKDQWFYIEKKGSKFVWQQTLLSLKNEIESLSHLFDVKEDLKYFYKLQEKDRLEKITQKDPITEKQDFINLLLKNDIIFKENTNYSLIRDEAFSDRANCSIDILSSENSLIASFYFRQDNKMVGYANESIDSYTKINEVKDEKK